jgi:hypothetical protein
MRYFHETFCFVFILFSFQQLFASPLVFKATKAVTTNELIELGSFDATKYRQIRIAVKLMDRPQNLVLLKKSLALIELNSAQRELKRQQELFQRGVISKASYDLSEQIVQDAQANYDIALENVYPPVTFVGFDDGEDILLGAFEKLTSANSIVIDSPPTRINYHAAS